MALSERLAQRLGMAVGVAVDVARKRAIGGDRGGAGPERALVRCETDRALDADDLGLATEIRGDVKDARTRHRTAGGRHRVQLSIDSGTA